MALYIANYFFKGSSQEEQTEEYSTSDGHLGFIYAERVVRNGIELIGFLILFAIKRVEI